MFDVSLAMALPVIILGALLIAYCLVDIVRTDRKLLLRKWQWALAVLILVPIGAFAYLAFEKLGIVQAPSTAPEELTTEKSSGTLFMRDR
jgi:hypothetical protein